MLSDEVKKDFSETWSPFMISVASRIRQANDVHDLQEILGTLDYMKESINRVIQEQSAS